jgi:hypothetical protein
MEERIRARIDELIEARKNFAAETKHTLYGMDVAIGELQAILNPDDDTEADELNVDAQDTTLSPPIA